MSLCNVLAVNHLQSVNQELSAETGQIDYKNANKHRTGCDKRHIITHKGTFHNAICHISPADLPPNTMA